MKKMHAAGFLSLTCFLAWDSAAHAASLSEETPQSAAAAPPSHSSSLLSAKQLDEMWENRESIESQRQIYKTILDTRSPPTQFEEAWRLSRMVYFVGNFGIGLSLARDQKLKLFDSGVQWGQKALQLQPERVEGYYWYAVNLGAYGSTKGMMSALGSATQGRDALLKAASLDASYHWGGPYRILGRYYQQAPSVLSFGDKEVAEEYFKKAISLAPSFRLNTFYLASLKQETGDKEGAKILLEKAKSMAGQEGALEEERYQNQIKSALDAVK